MLRDVWVLILEILRHYHMYFYQAFLAQFLRVFEPLQMLNLTLYYIYSGMKGD